MTFEIACVEEVIENEIKQGCASGYWNNWRRKMEPDPSELTKAQLAKLIRRSQLKIIADLEQVIRDGDSFNENRPDCRPLDFEWAKIGLDYAKRALAAWDRGDYLEAQRIGAEHVAYNERRNAK